MFEDKQEIIQLISTTMHPNYFQDNGEFYEQTQGFAMGAHILVEIYMQYIYIYIYIYIYVVLIHHKIIAYSKYVDDVLITYTSKQTDINEP
jgi:hypothetical protein